MKITITLHTPRGTFISIPLERTKEVNKILEGILSDNVDGLEFIVDGNNTKCIFPNRLLSESVVCVREVPE